VRPPLGLGQLVDGGDKHQLEQLLRNRRDERSHEQLVEHEHRLHDTTSSSSSSSGGTARAACSATTAAFGLPLGASCNALHVRGADLPLLRGSICTEDRAAGRVATEPEGASPAPPTGPAHDLLPHSVTDVAERGLAERIQIGCEPAQRAIPSSLLM
jgi:hypothetical protein